MLTTALYCIVIISTSAEHISTGLRLVFPIEAWLTDMTSCRAMIYSTFPRSVVQCIAVHCNSAHWKALYLECDVCVYCLIGHQTPQCKYTSLMLSFWRIIRYGENVYATQIGYKIEGVALLKADPPDGNYAKNIQVWDMGYGWVLPRCEGGSAINGTSLL